MQTNISLVAAGKDAILWQIRDALIDKFKVSIIVRPGQFHPYELVAQNIELEDFKVVSSLFYWLGYYVRMYRE